MSHTDPILGEGKPCQDGALAFVRLVRVEDLGRVVEAYFARLGELGSQSMVTVAPWLGLVRLGCTVDPDIAAHLRSGRPETTADEETDLEERRRRA